MSSSLLLWDTLRGLFYSTSPFILTQRARNSIFVFWIPSRDRYRESNNYLSLPLNVISTSKSDQWFSLDFASRCTTQDSLRGPIFEDWGGNKELWTSQPGHLADSHSSEKKKKSRPKIDTEEPSNEANLPEGSPSCLTSHSCSSLDH